MNKLLRQFLSGGSIAALQLCALGTVARASAPVVITTARPGSVVVAGSPDYIEVTSTGSIAGSLTNEGSVGLASVNSFGIRIDGGATQHAVITGSLINAATGYIHASHTGILVENTARIGGLSNAGKILVGGSTVGHGSGTRSFAARGIDYDIGFATGAAKAPISATLTNSGSVGVNAKASQIAGFDVRAYATAQGIAESANGNGSTIALTLSNSGSVALTAYANGHDAYFDFENTAIADHGLKQYADDATTLSETLTNSSTVTLLAHAQASSAEYVADDADAEKGIQQYADNATAITQSLTNSKSVTLSAIAVGQDSGGSYVEPYDYAQSGLVQGGYNAATISQTLTNSGSLNLAANANAQGTDENDVKAFAEAKKGIYQDATNDRTHPGNSISLSITNSGSVALMATELSHGDANYIGGAEYDGFGARAETGISQYAQNAANITESLTNNGSITLAANAKATGNGEYAKAYATATRGVLQSAYNQDDSTTGAITQSLTNSATFTITLSAKATQAATGIYEEGVADADAHLGAEQRAHETGDNPAAISQTLSNNGTIALSAVAKGTAAAAAGYDYVDAYAEDGVEQVATEYSSTKAGAITQALTNSGSITLSANAKATGSYYALAYAYAETGAEQYAEDQDSDKGAAISQSLTNSGTISLSATAKSRSKGTTVDAVGHATADARDGLDQSASNQDISNGGALTQSLTNNGTIMLAAMATGMGPAHVTANAYAEVGMKQYAKDEDNGNFGAVSQSLTNSASLTLSANAKAITTSTHEARAYAYAETGMEQYAENYDSSAAGAISQSLTNSGTFKLSAGAIATAVKFAEATAYARDGMRQSAENYDDNDDGAAISQTLTNSGTVTLSAAANAVAHSVEAVAHAYADTGLEQYAKNYEGNDNGGAISQSLTNSGTITLSAAANAQAPVLARTVVADAEARTAVNQYAKNSDYNINSGAISQSLTNSNSGTIKLVAVATALADLSGRATAEATADRGIDQKAYNYNNTNGGAISQSLTNNGTVTLSATANSKTIGAVAVADAEASADTGLKQYAYNNYNVDSGAISQALTNSNSGTIKLAAIATGLADLSGRATAQADADRGIYQKAYDYENNNTAAISQSLTNNGTITLSATANGKAIGANATARAFADSALKQYAYIEDNRNDAAAIAQTIVNSGTLTLSAAAKASGYASGIVDVKAYGVEQDVYERSNQFETSAATISQSLSNSGTIALKAVATATGKKDFARASAKAYGLEQHVNDYNSNSGMTAVPASLSITNSGTLSLAATAHANGVKSEAAYARAVAASQKLHQIGGTVSFANSGTVNVAAVAQGLAGAKVQVRGATASDTERAGIAAQATGLHIRADGVSGVFHDNSATTTVARGAPLSVAVTNSGTFNVAATAKGAAVKAGTASALAVGIGIQASSEVRHHYKTSNVSSVRHTATTSGRSPAPVHGTVSNSGTLTVSASAPGGYAGAVGIGMIASQDSVAISNAGTINVAAQGATALAGGIALDGGFVALGLQYNYARVRTNNCCGTGWHEHTKNTRSVLTEPTANVIGAITNSGTLNVSATGTVSADAEAIALNAEIASGEVLNTNTGAINVTASGPGAIARGIHIYALQSGHVFKHAHTYTSGVGSHNSHSTVALHTKLSGNSFTGTVDNEGTLSVTATGTGAKAQGILIEATNGTGSIVNGGTINAQATGTGAVAEDIVVSGTGAFTVNNNGGTLNSLVTIAGVTSFGTAIDLSAAPNTVIKLNGGTIAGNIVEASGGNAITAVSGNTLFNGTINPSQALLGSLTIASGATLTLGDTNSGPAGMAYVKSFTQPGTLGLVVTANPTQSGSIHAASATLSGPLALSFDSTTGVFGASATTYGVVFANALSGTWSGVTTPDTTFFSASAVYTPTEAAVTLTRTAFGAVAGLTFNEQQVGNAIEKIYDTEGLTGPLVTLTSALLNLTPAQYQAALTALSGEVIGQLAATNSASLQTFMDTILNHVGDNGTGTSQSASASGLAGVQPAQAVDIGHVQAWGGVVASSGSVDATVSGPSYNTSDSGLLGGLDFGVTPDIVLGLALGFDNGSLHSASALGKYSDLEISGYGRYTDDNDKLYALGDVSYGGFANNLNRTIAIPGLPTGSVHGHFDSNVVGLYGEGGYNGLQNVTPYVALSYLDASASPYTETGSFLAPLKINQASSQATLSYLGAKFAETWTTQEGLFTYLVTPSLKVAWEHDFTSQAWVMNASFAPLSSTASFGVNGAALSKDAAVINAGVTLDANNGFSVRMEYNGRLASDYTENSLVGRVMFNF